MRTLKKNLTVLVLLLLTTTLYSFDLPTHWFKAGSNPNSYEMGLDTVAGMDGKAVSTIKSIDSKIDGFGTLMCDSLPDKYWGKRIRMSGYLKTKDVSEWSGFWLRIDGKDSRNSLGFDNMHDGKNNRSIKGSTDWKKYEIVLDVPAEASNIAFGALLVGTGQIWFQDLAFDVVDESVPTTGLSMTGRGGDVINYIIIFSLGILLGGVIIGLVWAINSRKRRNAK